MNPVVFLVLGGAACAAVLVAGFALLPDDPLAAYGALAAGLAFHSCMIVLDLRSTAMFGLASVLRNERSVVYRRLAGRMGLAAAGACMWAIDYALVWAVLPIMVSGAWFDARATGMFLMVFGAIHAFGWVSNRSVAKRREEALARAARASRGGAAGPSATSSAGDDGGGDGGSKREDGPADSGADADADSGKTA